MKLPLEILRDKYIPLTEFPAKYGISVLTVYNLIKDKKIPYAEFKAPGEGRRSPHANPEDVLRVLEEEVGESHRSI